MLTSKAGKLVLGLVAVFVVYAILVSPNKSADVVRTAFVQLAHAGAAIGQFFNALIQK